MSNSERLRVCLLLGTIKIPEKFTREIRTLLSETNATISLLAIDETTANTTRPEEEYTGFKLSHIPEFFRILYEKGPKTLIWAEAYLASLITRNKTAYQQLRELETTKTHIDGIEGLETAERRYFTPQKVSEHSYEIPDSLVDQIVNSSDVVVLIGFNKILRGRILTEPRFGTLSLHWSDIRKYRGRPGCFWQFMNDEERIGLTLQQLTEELDGGNLIACEHADISDTQTWWEVRLRATQLYGPLLSTGIQRLQDPEYTPQMLDAESLGKMTYESQGYKTKNVFRMIIKNLRGRIFE